MSHPSEPSMDKATRLARFCHAATKKPLPAPVVHEVKRRVLDSVATALGSCATDVFPAVLKIAGAARPVGEKAAQVMGLKDGSLLEWAAFANGAMIRTLDFNDTYLAKEPAHPSDNIGAVIAAAQTFGHKGADAITGIANAYEVQCRLCDSHSLRAKGIDHVTYGNISVATSVSAMLGLDLHTTVAAIGIAGVGHTAIRQTREGNMPNWKAAAFANAARNGLFAVRAARSGFEGPAPIFEGFKGMEKVLCGEFELLMGNEGEAPEMILKTYIKPFPVEYHAQTATEAAIELSKKGVNWRDVEKIVVRTHKASYEIIGSRPEKWTPASKETADHSLPYITAIALIEGNVNLASFDESKYKDPEILAFLKRIECVEDAGYTARYGDSFSNHLAVTMKDGRKFEAEAHYPLGHPKNPMTDAQIEEKFRILAEGVVSKAEQDAFLKRCWAMETLPNLDGFYPTLIKMA